MYLYSLVTPIQYSIKKKKSCTVSFFFCINAPLKKGEGEFQMLGDNNFVFNCTQPASVFLVQQKLLCIFFSYS